MAADAVLFWLVFGIRRKLDMVIGGGVGSLEEALRSQKDEFKTVEHDIIGIRADMNILRKMAEPSIQKVSVVRFNPFGNVGGDHSFSIAFLDSKNSGVVLSSLHLRGGARVYSKPIIEGKSEYNLSDEEKQALEKAMKKA